MSQETKQPDLVTSAKCRFGWHTWTKWGKDEEMKQHVFGGTRPVTRQTRTCIHCYKLQHRIAELS